MTKQAYKYLLHAKRLIKRNPFLFKLSLADCMTKGILCEAKIRSLSIVAQSGKTQEEIALEIADLWINVAEAICNSYSHFLGGVSQQLFSIKNEAIKLLINVLNKVKEQKQ